MQADAAGAITMRGKVINILLVDDDPGDRRLVKLALKRSARELKFTIATADHLAGGLERLQSNNIDLVLLDLGLPDSHGLETVDKVVGACPHIPIVVLTVLADEETGLDALRRGASDYLVKGEFRRDLLLRSIRYSLERKELEQQLVRLASHDPLTGILNRRMFEEAMDRAIARARRGIPSVLLLFDVDHFKLVNDTLGHAAGDDVLVGIVQLVQEQLRTEDILGRMGGDEFAALFEGSPLLEAEAIAERLRQVVEGFTLSRNLATSPTLSIGLVEIDGRQDSRAIVSQADAAMYKAKEQGRNRVVCFEPKLQAS